MGLDYRFSCCSCLWIFFICSLLLLTPPAFSNSHHGNPANEIVDIINKNRTDSKLQSLNDSPGIGCMALQYVELCKGNCTNNTLHCKPTEDDFTEIFAPNCGVELPTFGSITGKLVGCHSKHLQPSEAFSEVLVRDSKTLSLLRNRTHTEVGVGVLGSHKGPFFWCVLFSSDRVNTTFVLEDHGVGIKQKKGCFSGSSVSCNKGRKETMGFAKSVGMLVVLLLLQHCN